MISREMRKVNLISYRGGTDDYGQAKLSPRNRIAIDMVVKDYTKNNTNDMVFLEVTKIGLTDYPTIKDADRIEIDGELYDVLRVLKGRYYEVLLKKH